MQVFANGKQCFHSFIEFYAIHLKNLIIVALLKLNLKYRNMKLRVPMK